MEDNNVTMETQPSTQTTSQGTEMVPIKPNNNLILAILTTVCFCLPLGIVAIIQANKVDSLYMAKQYQAAQVAANDAKKWSLIGIGVGVAVWILYWIYVAIIGAGSFALFNAYDFDF